MPGLLSVAGYLHTDSAKRILAGVMSGSADNAMTFPTDDTEFIEETITEVESQPSGSYAIRCGGWWIECGDETPIVPAVGMVAREYGRGIGAPVRGLFIEGHRFWYRTEAEDKEHHEIMRYGADVRDWLVRWDRGDTVWSIEMGGLGPGYEQCIHITAAEIVRWFADQNADASLWDDEDATKPIFDRMEKSVSKVEAVKKLKLSGAQWAAACNLASMIYRQGPRAMMKDDRVKNRHIQVCRVFPG